ncbi:MAG: class I SAM-dependent methyltransferase [Acidimicrobiales bacterium]|nr:class I SAM-dependent methyltransferase [Acidimicrobiales bacterium]
MASVDQFRYDFREADVVELETAELRTVHELAERRVAADSPECRYTTRWHPHPPHMMATEGHVGDTGEFSGVFTDVMVRFVHHPLGGIVDIFVDDVLASSVDLYTPEGSFVAPVIAARDLPMGDHTLVFACRGTAHPDSNGTQAHVEEIVLSAPVGTAGFSASTPINYGNPYSSFIEGYVAAVPDDDLILEVGGGDRRRCRPNHVNFEYLPFEFADVYGDIHVVPFADDTFSLVHSQAVFEHVNDPFAAARELVRVTTPGGIIVTEVAFLQPLHAVPFHFFNMTLWGVKELFPDCELLAEDWFGPLSETVEWLLRAGGVTNRVERARIEAILGEFREFDASMTHEDLKPVASGVHIAVRKPR